MRLRLNTTLRAALIAAITAVGFTLTQAYADEITATETWVIPHAVTVGSSIKVEGTALDLTQMSCNVAPNGNAGVANVFAPNANIGNGDTWTLTFTIDNTSEHDITLNSLLLDVSMYQASGGAQTRSTVRTVDFKLMTGTDTLSELDIIMQGVGDVAKPGVIYDSGDTKPSLTFGSGVQITAGSSQTFTLTAAKGSSTDAEYIKGCCYGLIDLVASYTYEGVIPTWKGGEHTTWSDSEAWNGGVPTASLPAVFDNTGTTTTVVINSAAQAASVNVSGKDYTFDVSEGGTLTTGSLAIASDASLALTGSGTVEVSGAVEIAAGAKLSVNGEGSTLTVGALTNNGVLDIGTGATVATSATVTLSGSAGLNVTGTGTFGLTTLNVTGGTHTITNGLHITGGGEGKGTTNRKLGLAVTDAGATISLLGDTNISGAMYDSAGTVNIGNGEDAVRVTTNRVEFGDASSAAASVLNVNANATLHVKGTDANAYTDTALILGEWEGVSTANIAGKLYADNATAYVGDKQATFNIKNGGIMAVKGISQNTHKADKTETISLNLEDGGKLVLGANGIASQKPINVSLGAGEVGISADSVTIAKDIALSGTGATTFNTAKYIWTGSDTSRELQAGTDGGALTVSGNITGAGTINKEGAGTLTLSGSLSEFTGAMNVNAGTLVVTQGVNASNVTVGTSGSLTLGGAVTFANNKALTNNGAVTLDTTSLVFNLNGLNAAEESGTFTYTLFSGNDVNLSGLTTGNITLAGGTAGKEWTFGTNGTISYTVTSSNRVWTNSAGTGKWNYTDANWGEGQQFVAGDIAEFNDYSEVTVDAEVYASVIRVTDFQIAAISNDATNPGSVEAESVEINGMLWTQMSIDKVQSYKVDENSQWMIEADQTLIAGSGTNKGNIQVGGYVGTGSLKFTGTATAEDLAGVTNGGTVSVDFGDATAKVDMEDSSGILEVRGGTVDYRSKLGTQTLKLGNGAKLLFGENDGAKDAPDFTNDIVLGGNATIQVYGDSKHSSVTISGDVEGAYTLTKEDGNQNLTFSGKVNIGGLTTATNGNGTIIFNGGEGSLGTIVTNGAVTIRFSAKDGADNVYSFDTFALAPSTATRWLIVDEDVTVNGTGSSLGGVNATIMNSWGVNGGGLEVNGTLNTVGTIGMDAGNNAATIKGTGIINTAGLDLANNTPTTIQGGITINITSDKGIWRRNNPATVHFQDATLQALTADWAMQSGYTSVTLDNTEVGTTFEAAEGHTITLNNALSGVGKLVKTGEGTLILKAANSYAGGTDIKAGTVKASNDSALGSAGAVTIAEDGTLEVDAALNLGDRLQSSGSITVNEGKSLTLTEGSSIYETITNAGTVNLTAVTLGDGFEEQGGGTAYFDLEGNEVESTANHYVGTNGSYVQVVSGGTVTGSGEADIMWKDNGYVLGTDGRIVTGTGDVAYDTFYVVTDTATSDIVEGAHYDQLDTIVVSNWAELNVDEAISGKSVEVQTGGFISGTALTPESVAIDAQAVAMFNDDVTTSDGIVFSGSILVSMTNTNEEGSPVQYSTDEEAIAVSADKMEMIADADVTVSNQLVVDEIVNTTDHVLTLNNVGDTLELVNMDITASTARVYTDLAQDTEATVSISGVLQGGEATLLANLTLVGGADSMLDVDGGGLQALTLGSKLTINTTDGLVNLDQDTIAALDRLSEGQWLDLIVAADQTKLNYGGAYEGVSYDTLFSAVGLTGPYTVYAHDNAFGLVRGSQVPEPTTGTLSLLALAALAARRRRK